MATLEDALHILVQQQFGTYLTPQARETVLRALEEVEALRSDRDSWRKIAERLRDARNVAIKALEDSSTVPVSQAHPPELVAGTVECVSHEKKASREEGITAKAGSPVGNGTVHGEAVPRTASDRREATEENRATSSGDAPDGEKEGAPEPESAPVLCLAPGCAEPGEINGCCVAMHSGAGPTLRRAWMSARAPDKE